MNISITFNATTVAEFTEALQAAALYAPQSVSAPRVAVNPPESETEAPGSPLVNLWKGKNGGAKFTPSRAEKARYGHVAPGPVPYSVREAVAKERLLIMGVPMEEITEAETSASGSAENLPSVPSAAPVDLSGMEDCEL